jgi:hypothetical protein
VENKESTPQMKIWKLWRPKRLVIQIHDIKEVKQDKGVKIAQKSTGESIVRTLVALELSDEVWPR